MGVSLFSQVTAIGPAVAPREVQVGYEEKVLQKSGAAVAQAAQGGGTEGCGWWGCADGWTR